MGVSLCDKYRPKSWPEVIGQQKALAVLDGFRKRGCLAGRWYWLSAKTGTGKTTIARLLAAELAEPYAIEELDATRLTPARLSELEDATQCKPLCGGGRVLVVNEAHGLSAAAVRQLDVWAERCPPWLTVIFTTTKAGEEKLFEGEEDAHPLLHRCTPLPLTDQGLARAAAPRLREIAQAEGLDGQDVEAYYRLMQSPKVKNSIRAALQAIDAGCMMVQQGGAA